MKTEIKSLAALLDGHPISAMANAVAYLYQISPNINWLGIYLYADNLLHLGPFQGKAACTPLKLDHGVCAYAYNHQKTVNVEDVEKFPGHIACDQASRSELVIPLKTKEHILGVLDIDAPTIKRFTKEDELFFEEAAGLIADYLDKQDFRL